MNKLVWTYDKHIPDASTGMPPTFTVKIIDITTHTILHGIVFLDKENFEIFKKIMKYDSYAIRYVYHTVLGECATIKYKLSPQKPIRNVKDPEAFKKDEDFYLGT
jgi:hypothetical protein